MDYSTASSLPCLSLSPRVMSIESAMLSNHFISCHPLLLLLSILPSSRIFPKDLALCNRWPKDWNFSFVFSLVFFFFFFFSQDFDFSCQLVARHSSPRSLTSRTALKEIIKKIHTQVCLSTTVYGGREQKLQPFALVTVRERQI